MKLSLVTCYYNIKSKQPHSQYLEWMGNLLKNINIPLIVYCDSSSKNSIEDIIKVNKNKFINLKNFYFT